MKIQNKCAIIYQRISISIMHINNLDLQTFHPICTIKKRCNSCKSCKSVLFSLWGPVQAREGLNTGWYAVNAVMIVHIHQGRHGGLPLQTYPFLTPVGRGNPPWLPACTAQVGRRSGCEVQPDVTSVYQQKGSCLDKAASFLFTGLLIYFA